MSNILFIGDNLINFNISNLFNLNLLDAFQFGINKLDFNNLPFNKIIILHLFIIFLFLLFASIYDLKYGIIPNKLSLFFIIYGFIFNLFLSICLNNLFILITSIILSSFVFLISFCLWKIGFWGGGDLKIFVSLSLSLSFLDLFKQGFLRYLFEYFTKYFDFNLNYLFGINSLDFINFISNSNFINLNNYAKDIHFVFYPTVFSILFNAILISLPLIILIFLSRLSRKECDDFIFNFKIFDLYRLIEVLSFKTVNICNLEEMMVLDKYYFKDKRVFDKVRDFRMGDDYSSHSLKLSYCDVGSDNIESFKYHKNDDFDYIANLDDLNSCSSYIPNLDDLNSCSDFKSNLYFSSVDGEAIYYFKSDSIIGLTRYDIDLIKELYEEKLICSSDFKIKAGIPFLPLLTVAYIIFIVFGDLIYLISCLFA